MPRRSSAPLPCPSPSRSGRLLAVTLLVAAGVVAGLAVPGCFYDPNPPASPPLPTPPELQPGYVKPARLDPVDPVSGLKRSDRQTFYHLAEGSEVYPLAFLLALDDPKTGKPFLQNTERFGLIADTEQSSDTPWVLPVGLTAARSRDLRFANVLMVGVNCAACHVGAIEYQGKPALRIDGAPNMLDLTAYYTALAEATQATLASPSATWTFLGRVYRMYRYEPPSQGPTGPGSSPGVAKDQGQGKGKGQGQGKGKGALAASKKKGEGAAKAVAKSEASAREWKRPSNFFRFSVSPQEIHLFGPPAGTDKGSHAYEGVAGLPVAYPSLDEMKQAGPAEKALAEAVERIHKEEMARPAPDLLKGLVSAAHVKAVAAAGGDASSSMPVPVSSAGLKALGDYASALHKGDDRALDRFGPELTEASAALRKAMTGDLPLPQVPGVSGDLPPSRDSSGASAPVPAPAQALDPAAFPALLQDLIETIRLLRARADFLEQLGKGGPGGATEPGPGRVDAFGGARNIVFPDDPAPETAPINYPHLWGVARTSWYHWDGNTTSLIERNIGQALGTGAVLVRPDYLSTVIVPNIERLEQISYGIRPPAWPEAVFGAIDREKFRRGAAIFRDRCASCHAPTTEGEKTPDRLYSLDEIGTDPNRARNFAKPVKGKPFHEAIAEVLQGTIKKAGGSTLESKPGVWRTTEKYPGRPLAAIWASAPYLHNGSVPTLYHLLLPDDQRPKTFVLGHREYDPKLLGYAVEGTPDAPRRWVYDTSKPGNSNKGHSGPKFGTDLPEPDRQSLLEYLKASERTELGG